MAAQRDLQEGRRVILDVDLEKFFDNVNQDVLWPRLAQRLDDTRILALICRSLKTGVMAHGAERAHSRPPLLGVRAHTQRGTRHALLQSLEEALLKRRGRKPVGRRRARSEEHTSELQSL